MGNLGRHRGYRKKGSPWKLEKPSCKRRFTMLRSEFGWEGEIDALGKDCVVTHGEGRRRVAGPANVTCMCSGLWRAHLNPGSLIQPPTQGHDSAAGEQFSARIFPGHSLLVAATTLLFKPD